MSAIVCDPVASADPAAERLFATVRRKLAARRAAWQLARAIRKQRRERHGSAFRRFAAAARAGNPEAQYRLGLAYALGRGRHSPPAGRRPMVPPRG